jgi:L-aspartate oxidase
MILNVMLSSSLDNLPSVSVAALVIGSGISGLLTAIKLVESGVQPVAVITKSRLSENNSRYAQGGIAAVVPSNTDDSIASHIADTLTAGAGRCRLDAVESILKEGAFAIDDLVKAGVIFDGSDVTHPALAKAPHPAL